MEKSEILFFVIGIGLIVALILAFLFGSFGWPAT